jgi:Family of unknown function (DUF6155)
MSKRDLKKYLTELNKTQLEEQIIALYDKFAPVKVYYDFVFNPKEAQLLAECKLKISHEYFPVQISDKKSRPKMRRSVAQKHIKHFISLGVDPFIIADVMLYTIEIAQVFATENPVKQELFYKSMLNSFQQAVTFIIGNGILNDFKKRIQAINEETCTQKWQNQTEFETVIERLEFQN